VSSRWSSVPFKSLARLALVLATQKAEIRRIEVQSQFSHIVHETLSQIPITKRAGRVAQGEGPEFKPHYYKKKKKKSLPD
jgi:hypothetical protein